MAERTRVGKKRRFEIFKRDKFTCQYCGRRPPDVVLQVDHIVPVAESGGNELGNLTTACMACNLGKGANRLEDVVPGLDEMQVLESVQEMLERQVMLKQQIEVERDLDDVVEDAHQFLRDRWYEEFYWKPHFDVQRIRPFFRTLDLSEMVEAMELAISWRCRQEENKNALDTFRYFCGIMSNMAKSKRNGSGG